MIGFILGTSEGKEILSSMNEFTENIVVSTATKYGGELLKKYKVKFINTEPLDYEGFKKMAIKFQINVFVDASHPYAQEVSKTVISVCKNLNIDYIRYDRKGYFENLEGNENIIKIESYEKLKDVLDGIEGNVLNTTGSNHIEAIMNLKIKNRIIHRVLPSVNILQKLNNIGVKIDDIVAIKGPFSYELNKGFIINYDIRALITKDSGIEGGTKEKVDAALDSNVKIILIEKPKLSYGTVFQDVESMVEFIKNTYYINRKKKLILVEHDY